MTQRNLSMQVGCYIGGIPNLTFRIQTTFGATLKFNIRLILRHCCLHAIYATMLQVGRVRVCFPLRVFFFTKPNTKFVSPI